MSKITEQRETEVEVRVGRSSFYNVGDAEANKREYYIQITDRRSGVRIMEVRLDATGFAEMLNSAGAIGTAELVSDQAYARSVGSYAFGSSIVVDRDFDGQGWQHGETRLNNLIENAAIAQEIGADYGSAHPVRDGLSVTFRGHTESREAAVREGKRLAQELTQAARNGGWAIKVDAVSFPSGIER